MIYVIFALCLLHLVGAAEDKHAETKSLLNEINPDGSYQWKIETSNDIYVQEGGVGGVFVQGAASWFDPNGEPIQFTYTADETGYHPHGDHLPTPPPPPPHVIEILKWIKEHPSNVTTTPSYDDVKSNKLKN